MLTAGALDKLNSTMGWQDISPKTADFASNFGKSIANNFASASINSALTGSSLEEGLQAGLLNAAVSTGMAFGAKAIGSMTIPDANGNATLNPAGQALAHALLGCVSGAATAGNGSGCTPGAAGALVGELAAQWYDPTGEKTDAQVLDFVKVVSAAAGALTGDGSAQSVNIASATGVNAVQNNFLETRDIKRAIVTLKSCTVGCDSLRRLLVSNESAGGEQTPVARLVDLCRANPEQCSTRVQDVAQALRELQTPEARAVLGAATADRLIQRQISDLGQALGALQWGVDHMESSKLVVRTALAVGATAVGAGVMLNIGRAVVVACGNSGGAAACSGLLTELTIGGAEAASGVPTLGLSAPTAAIAAARLKAVIAQTSDPAVIAKELQAVVAQAKVEQAAASQAAKVEANETKINIATVCTGSACFVAGTLIDTAHGPKAIETFMGGELVLSRHEHTQALGYRPVTSTKTTHFQAIYEVVVVNAEGQQDTLHTTSEHPFWVQGAGWIRAADLSEHMVLTDKDGQSVRILEQRALAQTATVYNIEVDEHHTYHVGALGVWVHNADCCDFTTKYGQLSPQWFAADGKANWVNPLTGKYEQIPDGVKVAVDHVLPQKFINGLPGFAELSPTAQESIVNNVANLQPMIASANCSKGCTVEWINGGWKTWSGEPVAAEYKSYLARQQQAIQDLIDKAIRNK